MWSVCRKRQRRVVRLRFARASAVAAAMADETAKADGWASRPYQRPAFTQEGSPLNTPFCETKPFVMLEKWHLYGSERRGCIDYEKMTNGFVSVRNAHARSHYPAGLETTRGGLAPSQGARLSGNEGAERGTS